MYNLIVPAKKKLEIGLGLFQDTNELEIKSIISHELGHITQPVYRSIVIPRQIIIGLLYDKDWWDRMSFRMYRSRILWGLFHYAGVWTINVTNWLKQRTFNVFKYEEQAYRELSRIMEFDADVSACRCTSSDIQVSTLSKIEVLSNRSEAFNHLLSYLIKNYQCLIDDFFKGKEIFEKNRHPAEHISLSYDELLTEPIDIIDVKSKVSITDLYDTHPTTEKRIEHALSLNYSQAEQIHLKPSWQLIPNQIIKKVSDSVIQVIVNRYGKEVKLISESDFDNWLKYFNDKVVIPVEMREFFEREILDFDPNEITIDGNVDNPFNDDNRRLVKETDVALHDLLLMQEIYDGETDITELSYDNQVYPSYKAPIEEHSDYYKGLLQSRDDLDINVYEYLMANLDETKVKFMKGLYSAIHFLNILTNNELAEMNNKRQFIIEEIHSGIEEDSFTWFRSLVNTHIDQIYQFVSIIKNNIDLFSQSTSEDDLNALFDFSSSLSHIQGNGLNTSFLNQLFHIDDIISGIVDNTKWWCKKTISSIAMELLNLNSRSQTSVSEIISNSDSRDFNNEISSQDSCIDSGSIEQNTSQKTIKPQNKKSFSFKHLIAVIPALLVLSLICTPILIGLRNCNRIAVSPPELDNIILAPNERTDGVIVFSVPFGAECNRILLDEDKIYVHDITDINNGYAMRVMGDNQHNSITREEFDNFSNEIVNSNDSSNIQMSEIQDKIINQKRCLERTFIYEESTDTPKQTRRFIVVESVKENGSPICIIDCWSFEDADPPLDELIKSIRIVER